jgi:MraZ protein
VADAPVTYTGQGFSPKGDKDRYVLPATFRSRVTESSGNQNLLLVTLHPVYNCLVGYGTSHRDRQARLIDARAEAAYLAGEEFNPDSANAAFGDAVEVTYDNSGRLIIPAHLRQIAGIDEAIYFHGFRDTFLMWSPQVLEAETDRQWLVAKAACASLVAAQKGRK